MKHISKKLAVFTVIVSFFLFPLIAFAAPEGENQNTENGITTRQDTKNTTQNTTLKDTAESVKDNKSDIDKKNADKSVDEKIKSANESGGAILPSSPPAEKPADMFTEKGMGENLLIVALGVGIFALLVAMVTFISAKSINGYIKASVNRRIDKLSLQIQDLERKLNNEIEKNATAARSYEKQLESVRAENQSRVTATTTSTLSKTPLAKTVAEEKPAPISESAPKRDNSKKFLEDYHNLMKLKGLSQQTAKGEFMDKYSVKTFACKNIDARMNNSSITPVYEEVAEGAKFWGFLDNGELLVVPALPFSYDNIAHGPGSMGEAFDSNFESGSFVKLEVITPAVFTERLRLVKKGEIRLIA